MPPKNATAKAKAPAEVGPEAAEASRRLQTALDAGVWPNSSVTAMMVVAVLAILKACVNRAGPGLAVFSTSHDGAQVLSSSRPQTSQELNPPSRERPRLSIACLLPTRFTC